MTNEELKKKMNKLMYFLVKEAARSSFTEFLEEIDVSSEDYQEIKEEFEKIGITNTYI